VVLCGIATEYCVLNTAEDLLKAGFKVTVLRDCLACVEEKGHYEALEAMKAEGIRLA
jgi:nicotinamidase/pyrazinamidase